MQSVFRLIAWIVIIVLAALLVFFVLKLLTQADPVFDQPIASPPQQSFILPPSTSSDTSVSTVAPKLIEPISPISIENNVTIVKSDEALNKEAEQIFRKKVVDESRLRLNKLMQDPSSISPKDVDDILADMSVLKDENGLVGGVNLDALRTTLKISDEMQTLALEIQAESELGENASSSKLIEQSRKMEELQYKLLEFSDSKKLLPGS